MTFAQVLLSAKRLRPSAVNCSSSERQQRLRSERGKLLEMQTMPLG